MFLTLMKNPISLSIWESSESCSVDLTDAAGSPNTQKYIFIPFSPASAGFFYYKVLINVDKYRQKVTLD
jgi:hypothetical protein